METLETKQSIASEIMRNINTDIFHHGFGIDNEVSYDESLGTTLYNGVGTIIDVYVHYAPKTTIVNIEVYKSKSAELERTIQTTTMAITEFNKIFKMLHSDLIQNVSHMQLKVVYFRKVTINY